MAAGTGKPSFISQSWGYEAVLHRGRGVDSEFLVKHLVISKNANLSYHLHERCTKTWTIVSGIGVMILDATRSSVSTGSCYEISNGVLHTLRAVDRPLQLVEVWYGMPLVTAADLIVAETWAEIREFLQSGRI